MSIFKFKQFEVDQTGCAMKINTDGVLIGALAHHPSPKHILDIGTGTGVMALMLAQRFPDAQVNAVEIDEQAAFTAGKNFQSSIFSNRLSISPVAIEEFTTPQKFDLIVSNPPFFVNDLKSDEVRKGIARHANEFFFEKLIVKTHQLLAEDGKLWLILPVKQAEMVIKQASKFKMQPSERIHLHSDRTKATFRQIICLEKFCAESKESDFYIYDSLKSHTEEYKTLLKDFFLAY